MLIVFILFILYVTVLVCVWYMCIHVCTGAKDVCVHAHVSVCVWCMCKRVQGPKVVSWSVLSHYFLKAASELQTSLALSKPPHFSWLHTHASQPWDYKHVCNHAGLLTYVLGIWTQSSWLFGKCSLLPSCLPQSLGFHSSVGNTARHLSSWKLTSFSPP